MKRVLNGILLAAMVAGAVITYNMKHKAEVAADRVAELQADVTREKQALTLLRAEWSVLTQPSRLQAIVQRHAERFKLEPFTPAQVATVEEVPLKPIDAKSESIAGIIAGSSQ